MMSRPALRCDPGWIRDMPDVTLGKYKLIRLLGEGGMGAVYEAIHTETTRHVALKIIRGDLANLSEEHVKRFQREARAAGAIDTQHIVQVLDAGTDHTRGIPYIALEYLKGEDFRHLLKRAGTLRPDAVLRVVGQACIGLQKAHEAGVLHRDIKPANLFLARRDEDDVQVKLLDFGIAKIRREVQAQGETTGLTQSGALLGTPHYMSPEQVRALRDIDRRSDIWSLGIVLYRALSGRTPHEHVTTLPGLVCALNSEPPQPIRDVAPWISSDIAAVLHRALQINREARFQSAAEMLEAIKALVPDGLSIRQHELVALDEIRHSSTDSPDEDAIQTVVMQSSLAEPLPMPLLKLRRSESGTRRESSPLAAEPLLRSESGARLEPWPDSPDEDATQTVVMQTSLTEPLPLHKLRPSKSGSNR